MTVTTEHRSGGRVLRSGEIVRINGARGLFRIQGFDTAAGTVDVYGGHKGRAMFRTFAIDRIGARPVEPNRRQREAA